MKPATVTNLIVILQWGNNGGEGEGEVEIIHMCIYMYNRVTIRLNAKKGSETSKSSNFKKGWPGDKIGMARSWCKVMHAVT